MMPNTAFGERIKHPDVPMCIIGIDPGESSGAICIHRFTQYTVAPRQRHQIQVINMMSLNNLRNLIVPEVNLLGKENVIIFLESPKGLPYRPGVQCPVCKQTRSRQGMGSTIKFFRHVGQLEGLLIGRKHQLVTPQAWQKRLNCMTKGDKKVSQAAAQQRYPQLKVTQRNADAILIAHYGCLWQLGSV